MGASEAFKIRGLEINYFHPPIHLTNESNIEILVVFQCKKLFVCKTTGSKAHLLRFFSEN